MKLITLFISILFAIQPSSAFAKKRLLKEKTGNFHSWRTYKTRPGEQFLCYSMSRPYSIQGNKKIRSKKPYLMVNYIAPYKQRVSIYMGKDMEGINEVSLSVDGRQFVLVTEGEFAISNNPEIDLEIIEKMLNSSNITVRFNDISKGAYRLDFYSLKGFLESYVALEENCDDPFV